MAATLRLVSEIRRSKKEKYCEVAFSLTQPCGFTDEEREGLNKTTQAKYGATPRGLTRHMPRILRALPRNRAALVSSSGNSPMVESTFTALGHRLGDDAAKTYRSCSGKYQLYGIAWTASHTYLGGGQLRRRKEGIVRACIHERETMGENENGEGGRMRMRERVGGTTEHDLVRPGDVDERAQGGRAEGLG